MRLSNRKCSDCEHCNMTGKHLPATEYDPEEFPGMDECTYDRFGVTNLNLECNENVAQICEYYDENEYDENKPRRSRRSRG